MCEEVAVLYGRLTFKDDPINGRATFVPRPLAYRNKKQLIMPLATEIELKDGHFEVELSVGIKYVMICAGGKVEVTLAVPGRFELKTMPKGAKA